MKKRLISAFMAAALILGTASSYSLPVLADQGVNTAAETEEASTPVRDGEASAPRVERRSVAEIRAFISAHPASFVSPSYSEEPDWQNTPYRAGKLSDATQQDALNALNQARYIAGLSADVALDQDHMEAVQTGCLVNAVNNSMSHTPSKPANMSEDQYRLGYSGTSSSNLGWGYSTLADAVFFGWMSDSPSVRTSISGSDVSIGHRRWCLNPTMQKTVFGYVNGQSAMYAFDGTWGDPGQDSMWPGYNTPCQYMQNQDVWTFSTGAQEDAANITVTLTNSSTGKQWIFSQSSNPDDFNVDNAGYGLSGCIMFRPEDADYSKCESYRVVIEGTSRGTISYTVSFFNLYSNPLTGLTINSGETLKVPVGKTVDIPYLTEPSNTDEPLHFTSYDTEGIIQLNGTKVTGLKKGTTWISLTNLFRTVSSTDTVEVYQPVTTIRLNRTSLAVNAGSSETLQASSSPEDADYKTVAWTSNNPSVATVSDDGTVHGVSKGTAVITAANEQDPSVKASCTVTVTDPPTPLYRLYNPHSGEHFYTSRIGERNSLSRAGWRYEGIAWQSPSSGTPVYRLYNPNAGDHHYTVSAGERNSLVRAGWQYEGIGWYSGGTTPVYRQYNPNAVTGAHNFTTSLGENNSLVRAGWRAEGIAWYAE